MDSPRGWECTVLMEIARQWRFAMGGVGGVCMIIEVVGGGNGWRKIICIKIGPVTPLRETGEMV